MAVKAVFAIEQFEPQSDGSYYTRLMIFSGANNSENVQNDQAFAPTALASTVNAALHGFVEEYIQSEWEVDFNPLLDSVKMLNPVSLV